MIRNHKYIYGPSDRTIPASVNLGDFFLNKLSQNKGKAALINGVTEEIATYDQILQESMNLAVSLTRVGVRRGDVVAVIAENRQEYCSTVMGIIYTGASVTTINMAYTKDEFIHVINISKPKFVFCSPASYERHAETYKSLTFIKYIILYGDVRHTNTCLYNDLATLNDDGFRSEVALTRHVKHDEFICADVEGQNHVAFILYSSGTTGMPKGVMLTHLNVLTTLSPTVQFPPTRVLSVTPWFHTMGLMSSLRFLTKGSTMVYLTKFEVDLYLRTIEKYKVVEAAVVPAILVALNKSDREYDTSSLQLFYCGAAPMTEETAADVRKKFPSVQLMLQSYGMTETTIGVTFNMNSEKIGSVGSVVSHNIMKVVDPETREALGPNREGEICVKGVMVMKGYVGKDKKEDYDDEGFYRTGDVGYYDEEGYFYIVDRLKELIKYKGYQVAPAELEAVLLKHDGVKDAGVVGVPHRTAGEVPLAFIVTQPNVTLTEKEVQEFVTERLSNPKHLRGGVRFINEIPKNQTGKILRKDLRRMVEKAKSKL